MCSRGSLIVFEGLDRSGKSTQAKKLVEYLKGEGKKAELFPFPDRKDPLGQIIDQFLRKEIDLSEPALHLLFSANRWQKVDLIKQKIEEGTVVVCDRYAFSGVAYSLAKGMDSNWVRQSDVGLPQPDVVLFFEVSPEVARQRGGFGEERLETEELQRKVAEQMRGLRKDYWKTVNADKDMDDVERQVHEIVKNVNVNTPLGVMGQI